MSDRPVLVMAGGTGGHVFPGLAVARALTDAGVPVEWLGTHRGLEAKLVPPTGIPVNFVSVGGLRGKSLMTRLLGPVRIVWAVIQSLVVMARLRPRTVLGMGGFVSGPGGIAAWITRRRLVIHEQNAIAGLTNRLLSRLAGQVLQAFPSTFPEEVEAVTVGNPVRPEISAIEPPATRLAIPRDRARLLVFGGSQGALKINEVLPAALARLPDQIRPEVLHQTGERTREVAEQAYESAGVHADVRTFIDDMAGAYAWADLAVCRAGALTVAELAEAGLGSVLIPFPAAVDDHQTRNAAHLELAGAARLIQERDLTPESLAAILEPLLADAETRRTMAIAARSVAHPEALDDIVQACLGKAGRMRQ